MTLLGTDIIIEEGVRHVRDMWKAAHDEQTAFVISSPDLAMGSLAVFGRDTTL